MAGDPFSFSRSNAYKVDPLKDLCIITPRPHPNAGPNDRVDPDHPACEKFERGYTEEELDDYNVRGVVQAIRAQKDGVDLAIVVDGRRRTRIAREVNRLRALENKTHVGQFLSNKGQALPKSPAQPLLQIKFEPWQGSDLELRGLMMAANVQREGYTPTQLAYQIADYVRLGASEKLAAQTFAIKPSAVKQHLALLDCDKSVQASVDAKTTSLSAAVALSALPREKQKEKLAASVPSETEKKPKKLTAASVRKDVHKERTGKEAVLPPTKKEIREAKNAPASTGLAPEVRDALHWVLTGERVGAMQDLPQTVAA